MRLAALTLALTGAAFFPSSASAYVVGGFAWPGTTIRYYTAVGAYRGAVDRAARNWNRAAVGVRLAASSRASADVVVTYGTERCGGVSPMGYGGRYVGTTMRLGAGCSRRFITLTATHEFGHILGLDHETSTCARMNPSFSPDGTPALCRHHSLSYSLAHPLESDDIRGARAIYRSGTVPIADDDPYDGYPNPYDRYPWEDRGPRWP